MDIDGANSDLDLAIIALDKVGHRAIAGFDEEYSKAARTMRQSFELERTSLLQEYSWNFPNAFKTLPIDLTAGEHPRFENAYAVPKDCLRVREVVGLTKYDWQIAGKYIWCNAGGEIVIDYTNYNKNVTEYGSLFRHLFVFRLAVVAATIPGDYKLSAAYMRQGELLEIDAKNIDGNEGNAQLAHRREGRYRRARRQRYR